MFKFRIKVNVRLIVLFGISINMFSFTYLFFVTLAVRMSV